jgi:hypothetical protein
MIWEFETLILISCGSFWLQISISYIFYPDEVGLIYCILYFTMQKNISNKYWLFIFDMYNVVVLRIVFIKLLMLITTFNNISVIWRSPVLSNNISVIWRSPVLSNNISVIWRWPVLSNNISVIWRWPVLSNNISCLIW